MSLRRPFSFVVFVLVTMTAPSALAVIDCELDGKPINLNNGNATAGKTGLIRCHQRDTGELQREQEIRDGTYEGVVRFYHDGVMTGEYHINRRGNRHGVEREFHDNGKLKREATKDDGDTVGMVRTFDENGRMLRVAFHEEGHEVAYAELNDSGQLSGLRCAKRPVLRPHVDDGKLCGFASPHSVSFFNHAGEVTGRTTFDQGLRTRVEHIDSGVRRFLMEVSGTARTETRFSNTGTPQREEVTAEVEGRRYRVSDKEFDERGNLQTSVAYCTKGALGRPLRERRYYMNGQLSSEMAYYYDAPERVVERAFSDTGTLVSEGSSLVDGYRRIPTGIHRNYDEHGTLRGEQTYDTQGRLERIREYDEHGTVTRDDAVFPDGSRRAYQTP